MSEPRTESGTMDIDNARVVATIGTYEVVHNPDKGVYPYEVHDTRDGIRDLWEEYATESEAINEAKSRDQSDRIDELREQVRDRLRGCDDLETLQRIAGWLAP